VTKRNGGFRRQETLPDMLGEVIPWVAKAIESGAI
jgi:hypothetical protein